MDKKLYTIIVYTENIAGMLNQVTAEFTRRMMNIDTITASSSSVDGVHRYTISLWGEEDMINKDLFSLENHQNLLGLSRYFEFFNNETSSESSAYGINAEPSYVFSA